MMPNTVSWADSTITGPNGPVSTCTLHAGNSGSNGTAQSILAGENAVVVMPRDVLANGEYTVTVNTNSGSVTWSFAVDTNAPLQFDPPEPPPVNDTEPNGASSTFVPGEPFRLINSRKDIGTDRLLAGETVRIETGELDAEAISANFVAVWPSASGHLRLFNCTDEVPTVSTVNYVPGANRANQAIVPVDDGDFCVYSSAEVDLIVDVNGYYYGSSDESAFTPAFPERLYNSRDDAAGRLRAGVERRVQIIGAPDGPPANASAAALNVTAVGAPAIGYLQVYPCGAERSLETSTINYPAVAARPNTVVVGADDGGYVCLRSLRDVDVLIDYAGYFADGSGSQFTPLDPIRLFDSRQYSGPLNESTYGGRVRGGEELRLQIAGERGVPGDAKAVSINLTATQALSNLYVTAYPCGVRPGVSNLNTTPGATNANGAMVKLSESGELCLYARRDVHLLVDINGVWR